MNKLSQAIALRKQEKYHESNRLLLEIWEENRNDPEINYQCAWSFDVFRRRI